MKKVYFVQAGVDFGNTQYIPYAAGTIIANCKRYEDINAAYEFPDIIFMREKLSKALDMIKDPYLVGFSNNIWNIEYNKALSKLVKRKYPECIVIFGGHSVYSEDLLNDQPQIDILIFGEGEQVFAEILKALPQGDLSRVPSLAYRKGDSIIRTPAAPCINTEDYPSPYTEGVFDQIIADHPEMDFTAVFESNRGCPYSCAFCEWTHGKKMRFFPLDRIKKEIQWFADHQIEFVYCIDSNFGLFDRDFDIIELFVDAKKKFGYPQIFRVNYEKNSTDRVFRICKRLNEVKMDRGATLSYQTLCPEALKNIGRKNLTMEHFSGLMKKYTEAGIATYSELILGFPGETYDSFCRGICRLMENGQHGSLFIYLCELLPNAMMSDPEYVKKHKIEGIKVYFQNAHSVAEKEEEVHDYSYLVHSTATMNVEDWIRCNLFSICVQCFHFLGALRFFAIYLYKEDLCGYFDFYKGLAEYILASPGRLGSVFREMKSRYENGLKGNWYYYKPEFDNINWTHEEGAFLETIKDYNGAMKEILPYLKQFDMQDDVFKDLLLYQKNMIRKPGDSEKRFSLSYDLPKYYEVLVKDGAKPLEKKDVSVYLKPRVCYTDIKKYAREIVWYGRRREAVFYKKDEFETIKK